MNNKSANKDTITERDSFSELLGQLANNSATVVRDEIELVKRGIQEKIAAVRSGVIAVVIGAAIGFAAFLCLCAVLIIGLTSYMTLIMASLVTGVALSFVAGIVGFIGYRILKKSMTTT